MEMGESEEGAPNTLIENLFKDFVSLGTARDEEDSKELRKKT